MEREKSISTDVTFALDMNVPFIFEDNNRTQPNDSFDEKEKDLDISSDGNDTQYCPDDKTESDASSCESINLDEFDSVNVSTGKEPKFLFFFVRACCPYQDLVSHVHREQ